MAIKRQRQNPVVVLDVAIAAVERDAFTRQGTGEVVDRGRKVAVSTGQGPDLEVKIGVEHDDVAFDIGTRRLIFVDYNEWSFTDESGRDRSGSTMKYLGDVQPANLAQWTDVLKSQKPVSAAQ